MGKTIFLVALFFSLFLVVGNVNALTLEAGVEILPSESNTTYEVNTTLSLDTFDVESNAPYFDGYIFQIEPYSESATVMINSWNPPTMEFEVNATDETTMTLGGFTPGTRHGIYVDGAYWKSVTTGATGLISFTYPHFSMHLFSVDVIPQSPSGPGRSRSSRPSEELGIPEMPEPENCILIVLTTGVAILIIIIGVLINRDRKRNE